MGKLCHVSSWPHLDTSWQLLLLLSGNSATKQNGSQGSQLEKSVGGSENLPDRGQAFFHVPVPVELSEECSPGVAPAHSPWSRRTTRVSESGPTET